MRVWNKICKLWKFKTFELWNISNQVNISDLILFIKSSFLHHPPVAVIKRTNCFWPIPWLDHLPIMDYTQSTENLGRKIIIFVLTPMTRYVAEAPIWMAYLLQIFFLPLLNHFIWQMKWFKFQWQPESWNLQKQLPHINQDPGLLWELKTNRLTKWSKVSSA